MSRPTPSAAVRLLRTHFGPLPDRRKRSRTLHPLLSLIFLALAGTLTGARGWDELADFADERKDWLAALIDLPKGPPSADTIRRAFEAMRPRAFADAFAAWAEALAGALRGQVVAADGKAVRGAVEHAGANNPLHLLHVWATDQRLLLGQRATNGAPGEAAALVELLAVLELKGATVTTDAGNCTRAVAHAVREAGADYLLCLRGNRRALHDRVRALFEGPGKPPPTTSYVACSRGHGRHERRRVLALGLEGTPAADARWAGLRTAVRVERTRTLGGRTSTEVRYYITSLPADARALATKIRAHGSVENQLHWSLDVGLAEDACPIRKGHGAENLAAVRRMALTLLQRDTSHQGGLVRKQKRAALSPTYLLHLLSLGTP
ncbi:MAG TPA: ISAs1 family transposase [Polyangiaceae bacterium]|nr:ISAs1 family transposase [Polyangiaceae bacterium]